MAQLIWKQAKRLTSELVRDMPCYEAEVEDRGKYRVAPVVHRGNRLTNIVGYETFFIPAGTKSATDVRDVARYHSSMNEAKAAAQADYDFGRRPFEF